MKNLTKFEVSLIRNGKESDPRDLLRSLITVNDGGNTSRETKWDLEKVKLAQKLAKNNQLEAGVRIV